VATLRAMPVLQVSDVALSAAFYERLGFSSLGSWGDPPGFCIVQRGDVTLALDRSRSGEIPRNQWWAAYVYVDDAEALRSEMAQAGLEPTAMHRPEDYGCIDFDVVDPDGHRIAFGQALNPVPGPGLSISRGLG
jgi:predicted enzyme related to lactoylglutathione lyase